MASNVFGNPITEGTRMERAVLAKNNENADGKREKAIAYVRNEKLKSGNGVSTLCFFYNATGEPLFYGPQHDWYGQVWDSYPQEVQNGQWGAFLHVKNESAASGSMAYVTYRVQASDNAGFCCCLISWETPWDRLFYSNHAFCDVYDDGNMDDNDTIYNKLNGSGRQIDIHEKGMWMTAIIESDTSPLFEAHFILEGA